MIKIHYNGQEKTIKKETLMDELLENFKEVKGIAISCNYAVVPKKQWKTHRLNEGDQIDVLQAIQGG